MESRRLLISDVDGTLLGDDDALAEFAAWRKEHPDRLLLAYSSGRFVASIQESIAETALPEPDAIVGGVGTDIWLAETKSRLAGWPTVDSAWSAEKVRELCLQSADLQLQPQHLQSEHKVSFYGFDLETPQLDQIRAALAEAGIDARIVYSSQRDLDVLPASVDKGSAAARVAEHFQMHRRQVIVSGDSGNDLAMFQQGFRGIVVANAHPELKALSNHENYHAQRSEAGGVLEGLKYWLQADNSQARSASE